MAAQPTTVIDKNVTVLSRRPARDSPSRARPTAAMRASHTFWNPRYCESRLPNIWFSLSSRNFHFDFAIQWQRIPNRFSSQGPVEFLEFAASSTGGKATLAAPENAKVRNNLSFDRFLRHLPFPSLPVS